MPIMCWLVFHGLKFLEETISLLNLLKNTEICYIIVIIFIGNVQENTLFLEPGKYIF
jgi:hypothetical protein